MTHSAITPGEVTQLSLSCTRGERARQHTNVHWCLELSHKLTSSFCNLHFFRCLSLLPFPLVSVSHAHAHTLAETQSSQSCKSSREARACARGGPCLPVRGWVIRSVTCHHWFLPAAVFFNLPKSRRGREGGREGRSTVKDGWYCRTDATALHHVEVRLYVLILMFLIMHSSLQSCTTVFSSSLLLLFFVFVLFVFGDGGWKSTKVIWQTATVATVVLHI